MRVRGGRIALTMLVSGLLVGGVGASAPAQATAKTSCKYTIGIIGGQLTNPYFATLENATRKAAQAAGLCVITAEAKAAGDSAAQITGIQDMINRGVKGISMYPANGQAVVPYVTQARQKGILVIAVDTQTIPANAVNATVQTNNYAAGKLIGRWAKLELGKTPAHIGLVDYDLSNATAKQRHDGFLAGFGTTVKSPNVAGMLFTKGDADTGQTVMENLLSAHPDINVVYSVNEPAAFGAAVAIQSLHPDHPVYLTSIDGSCTGAKDVKNGKISATVMQLPAAEGQMSIKYITQYVATGKKPSGIIDSGEQLITDHPVLGLASKNSTWDMQHCWGG